MKVYIGADHRGKTLATALVSWLEKEHDVEFVGNHVDDPHDDYVDFAAAVGRKVSADPTSLGVAICGSGVGMDIAANKITGVRATLGYAKDQVVAARNDDDTNVLALGSDFLKEDDAKELVEVFLKTPFAHEERFIRRVDKVKELEVQKA